MNFFKFLLFLLAVGLGVWLIFWLLGVISAVVWYLFWFGLIALGGYIGYKLFLDKMDETPQLEEKKPVSISEMQDFDRALEDYKRKSLSK